MSSTSAATTTIELVQVEPLRHHVDTSPGKASAHEPGPSYPARTLGVDSPRTSEDARRHNARTASSNDAPALHHDAPISSLPAPTTLSQPPERWNHPRVNRWRVLAAFWSLMVMGMNDAAYGAILPYLGPYYDLSYTLVSLIFLSPFVGYTLSALLNNWVHTRLGQRGVAALCSGCHLAAYAIACAHPPYPALVAVYVLAGFGNGLGDAAWNAWVGAMARANEVLGVLHACYGLGGVLAPLVATAMITRLGRPWHDFYYVMVAAAAVEAAALVSAFWAATGAVFRDAHPREVVGAAGAKGKSRMHEALAQRPAARVTWLCAIFLLCYVGVEVALGGWIVTFMINVRHGTGFASGLSATGFWLGLTVGRVVLGFVTPRLGERLAIMVRRVVVGNGFFSTGGRLGHARTYSRTDSEPLFQIYLPAAMALELLFWLVPQFVVSAVAVALQGFFLGPLFPAVVVAATKSLPKHLHVSTIGFAAAFGGGGAAVLPFAVGAIAQSKGVGVLQPIILTLLGVLLLLWMALPNFNKKRD